MRSAALVFALVLLTPSLAHAKGQGASPSTARELFDSALADMRARRWSAACPKLEQGLALDPGTGMKFNLALCYENTGRLGSAYALFSEVADESAQRNKPQRERSARQRMRELAPKVPFLRLTIPADARPAGLEVRLDGSPVDAARWEQPLSMDPGMHRIEVRAPQRKPLVLSRTFESGSGTFELAIPALEKDPPHSSPAASSSAGAPEQVVDSTLWTPTRTAGVACGAVGIVAVAAAGFYGLRAMSRHEDSNDAGCSGNLCNSRAADIRNDAMRDGNISTVAFAFGSAAVAVGATLWVVGAPDSPRAAIRPVAGDSHAGLLLEGAW